MKALVAVPAEVVCEARHCDEEHPDFDRDARDDALRHAVSALAEAWHRTHDRQFPWRLCSDEVCRETAHALGVR